MIFFIAFVWTAFENSMVANYDGEYGCTGLADGHRLLFQPDRVVWYINLNWLKQKLCVGRVDYWCKDWQ
ncbi:MAG: hypothetical protein WCR04_01995 [Fibrobacteraceae bacterium]